MSDGAAAITTPLEGALEWARRRGFPTFPCERNGKRPLMKQWQARATTDEEQIRAWGEEYPGCNWACVPHAAGCFVVDLDVKDGKDGVAALKALAKEHDFEIPDTLIVRTPTGGFHLYFAGEGPNSASKIGEGIDIRGRGGFVLIPGSQIDGARYEVVSDA